MDGDKTRKKITKGQNDFVKAYLVAYNVSQTLGWLIMLVIAVSELVAGRRFTFFEKVEPLLKIFQTAALLEIAHCAIGFVRSNVVLTAVQVYSRVFVVWAILHSVPDSHGSLGVLLLVFAWSVTEIIRYSFYFFSLLGGVPYFITWLRYTLFIVLYPIGVTGEILVIWSSMPFVKRTHLYSLDMPNQLNVSFSFFYFLWMSLLLYIPVFPQLYIHMLSQRKKVVGGARLKTE